MGEATILMQFSIILYIILPIMLIDLPIILKIMLDLMLMTLQIAIILC